MKLIDHNAINAQINRCYLDFDPDYPANGQDRIGSFKWYLERTAGLLLDFTPVTRGGKFGYQLIQAAVTDEKKYMLFLLKYTK